MEQEKSTIRSRHIRRLWQRQEVWYLLAAALSAASLMLIAAGTATDVAFLSLLFASLSFGLGLLLHSAPEDSV